MKLGKEFNNGGLRYIEYLLRGIRKIARCKDKSCDRLVGGTPSDNVCLEGDVNDRQESFGGNVVKPTYDVQFYKYLLEIHKRQGYTVMALAMGDQLRQEINWDWFENGKDEGLRSFVLRVIQDRAGGSEKCVCGDNNLFGKDEPITLGDLA